MNIAAYLCIYHELTLVHFKTTCFHIAINMTVIQEQYVVLSAFFKGISNVLFHCGVNIFFCIKDTACL